MYYSRDYMSPLGDILIVSDENSITGLWIGEEKHIDSTKPKNLKKDAKLPILNDTVMWLDKYFAGKKVGPSNLNLAPKASEFRQKVWKILMEVPYGELITYGAIAKEVAKSMGKDKMSAQAVGGAVGHNPISIIIPCHRVIGANGNLTGYAGGIEKKIKLLDHEGVDVSKLFLPKKGTAL